MLVLWELPHLVIGEGLCIVVQTGVVRQVKAATAWSLEVEGEDRLFPAGDSYPSSGPLFLSTRCDRLYWVP